MKKYTAYILLLLPFLMLSCTEKKAINNSKQLTVSILPQKQMLEHLSAGIWDVQVLLPPGSNHETYEPTPQDMKKLSNSSLYFTLGALDFETTWTERFQASNTSMQIVPTNKGIKMLCGHVHSHDEGDAGHNHNHSTDPHIWLSARCLAIQASNICETLCRADSSNKSVYENQLASFNLKVDSVDQVIKQILKECAGKPFFIYHPSLGYFAQDYNLNQISIEDEGKEPSASHLVKLTQIASENHIKAIYISKEFDTRHAEALAKDIGAKIIVFDPLAEDWANNLISIAKLIAEN